MRKNNGFYIVPVNNGYMNLGTLILIISIPAYFIFKRLLLTTDDDIRRIIEKS
jgi:hypothetical protein